MKLTAPRVIQKQDGLKKVDAIDPIELNRFCDQLASLLNQVQLGSASESDLEELSQALSQLQADLTALSLTVEQNRIVQANNDANQQEAFDNHVADTSTHGTASAIVGVNDIQTLTNKTVDRLQFDTTQVGSTAEGQMAWNSDEGTVEIGMPGGNVNLAVGQEMYVPRRCKNTTGSDIPNGSLVYINGVSGNTPTIALADADLENASHKTIGMTTEDIGNNNTGYVTTFGIVRDVNTNAYTVGTELWLSSTAGGYTSIQPMPPKHSVSIGYVLRQNASEGEILVNIRNGYDIADMHDVNIGTTASGQLLVRDETNRYWENTANVLIDDTTRTLYSEGNGGTAADFNLACGTDKTLKLVESVWVDIDFPIIVRTTGAGIPSLATLNGNITMPQWAVNDFNVCESQELIHSWKEGTEIHWHIHLTTNGLDATNRYVRFELEYGYNNGHNTAWTFPAVVDTGDLLIPANTADKTQLIMSLATFTPSSAKIGAHVVARLKRIASAGAAPTNNPWIPMLQIHVECDTIGSRQIGTK